MPLISPLNQFPSYTFPLWSINFPRPCLIPFSLISPSYKLPSGSQRTLKDFGSCSYSLSLFKISSSMDLCMLLNLSALLVCLFARVRLNLSSLSTTVWFFLAGMKSRPALALPSLAQSVRLFCFFSSFALLIVYISSSIWREFEISPRHTVFCFPSSWLKFNLSFSS